MSITSEEATQMTSAEVLADAFERVRGEVHHAVEGLSSEELAFRIDADANSVAWLVWHLTRVQDDHIAAVAGTEQLWTSSGWADRFALPLETTDTGYGHTSEQVGVVRCDAQELLDYFDAVLEHTLGFVNTLGDDDLERIVDTRWNPPVTLGVRLVSVIDDDVQHAGQAAYVRGILGRR
jgi:uncharacterized damage-inducible protein DinB